MGGSFDIQSQPSRGTLVTLILPVGDTHAVAQVVPEKMQALSGNQIGNARSDQFARVLLVDDHAMMRQGLRSILTGYSDLEVVGEAANGVEALCAVEQHRPAVVIMDINMPEMDGVEATVHLKTRYPDMRVIGLSVNAGRENQEAMLKAGASLLLTKEATVEQLYGAIQDVIKTGHITQTS
jgi:DNA-binding NarL/FixJ family response regulator